MGALLYELVVGQPPHFDQDHIVIYRRIVSEEPDYADFGLSEPLIDLLKRLLCKDPAKRYQTIRDIKNHPWLSTVDWTKVIRKEYRPPIIPGPNSCCIDEEFLSLDINFEDSAVPLNTERRQSCYYESTIMLKTLASEGNNTLVASQIQ